MSVYVDILLIFVQIGLGKFCKLVYFTNLRGVLGCGALVFIVPNRDEDVVRGLIRYFFRH